MIEFGVAGVRTLESFKGVLKKKEGAKPMLFFAGDGWEQDTKWTRIKNLLIGAYARHPLDHQTALPSDDLSSKGGSPATCGSEHGSNPYAWI
jgi:hypothetical protein